MIRNFKALGLAVIAVLAMGVVAVSAAQATTLSKTTGAYPVTVTETQEGANTIFKVGAVRSIECSVATLDATLAAASAVTTLTAVISGCSSTPSSLPATVNMKSCDFTIKWNTPVEPANTTGTAALSIDCSTAGDAIHLTVYKAAEHTEANVACTYAFGAQGPIPGTVEYHNIGSGTTAEVTLEKNLKEIKTKVITGTKLLCGGAAGETVNATLIGNAKLTGEVAATKEHVGIAVVH